ncbi:hypothetical protein XaavBphi31_15 [Xanthomonas phage Xaa_vB_phi31]|uniref:Uncharacterized protein n=1 Tax=Xanthomonas phage Xaa_vB_phi31 TaxID=2776752 RepID=A0A868BZ06_9CAUD|nr:hypothetical protein XaavBphi31_15 [Xanthomonas phage Xaa_vB_phi31]
MSNNIRTAAAIAAQIDAINAAAEASQTQADGGQLTVLSLEAKARTAIEKFEKAAADYEAQAAVRDVKVGDAVSLVFGRAANKQILSGNVLNVEAAATGLLFTVLTGEGAKSRVVNVGADALLLTGEAKDAAELAIELAKEEAAEAARQAEASKGEGAAE